MSQGPQQQPATQAHSRKNHLVLTCLLMATTKSGSAGAVDPVDIPTTLSLQKSVQPKTEQFMASPVFSPLGAAAAGGAPHPFELSPRDNQQQLVSGELRAVLLPGIETPAAAAELLEDVRESLASGGRFTPAEEGDGVWIISTAAGKPIAVWKSQEEELEDRSNTSTAIEQGCACGQRAQREYMAYLVDQALPPDLRAGVPPTLLVEIRVGNTYGIRQAASIQRFVENKGTSEEWGCSRYDHRNVQRIALFDLLTINLDRHGGNLLVSHDGQLVPIDHGYALPETLVGEPWLDWRLWPQASVAVDADLCNAVMGLSQFMTKSLATALGLPDGVWQTSANMVKQLQQKLEKGWTLRMIAESLMHKKDPHESTDAAEMLMEGLSYEGNGIDCRPSTQPMTLGSCEQVGDRL